MYAKKMKAAFEGQEESPFFQFSYIFLESLEEAKTWMSVDHLLSVIQDRSSLRNLVDGMEQSEAKDKLSDVLAYDESYYSKLVASLIPFLKSVA